MVDVAANKRINRELDELYSGSAPAFLAEWSRSFGKKAPDFLNNFGIVDEERYDADNGILFVSKETNNFSNEHYRRWLLWLSRQDALNGTNITPNMWYNVGRWASLCTSAPRPASEIAALKADALNYIGNIAFTNINKVYGENRSKQKYYNLALSDVAGEVLRQEIYIIKPKTVVCCGTGEIFLHHIRDFGDKLIFMPHPGARKNTEAMLREFKMQLT